MTERLQRLQSLLEASPNDSFILFAIAKEYEKASDFDTALDYYLRLKTSEPDYVGLYYHLGKLYEVKEDFDAAVATYQTGMEVAKKLGDKHSLSELVGAKLNLVDE